jgi:putative PEP-CTERM system TPR-repeat lipoprotein
LLGLGRLEDAERIFAATLELHPEHIPTLLGMARLRIGQGNYADAEVRVDKALALDPNNLNGLALKGDLRRFARDFEASEKFFSIVLDAQPGNNMARLGRASALIELHREKAAKADIDTVLQAAPRHPIASHLSALMLVRQRKYQEAHDRITAAGDALRNFIPSVFLLGTINYMQNQLEQAEANLSRVVTAKPEDVTARFFLGLTLLRKRDAAEAVRILEPIKELAPDNPRALSLLARAYLHNKQYDEGTELFERVAELAPEQAGVRAQLAIGRLTQGLSEEAVSDLEKAIELDPNSHQAAVWLVLVHLKNGSFDDAFKTAQRLSGQLPDQPLPFNLMGAALQGKGDIAGARAQFEKALAINPSNFPASQNLASLDIAEGKIDAAIARYRGLIDDDPKNVRAYMELAGIAQRQRRIDDAVSWLEQAQNVAPDSVAVSASLVNLYIVQGKAENSLTLARELERKAPDNPRALEALGRAQMASNDAAGAVTTYSRMVDKLNDQPEALLQLAQAQSAAQNPGGARRTLERALVVDSNFVPAKVLLVRLLAADGQTDSALSLSEEVRAAQPQSSLGDMLKGDVLASAERYADAAAAFEAGLQKQPGAALSVRLYNVRMKAGMPEKALSALSDWLEKSPSDAKTRHVLASAYLGLKRYDDAIQQYLRLREDGGDNPVILNNLAWLYQQKGDAKAIEFAEKAYEMAPKSAAIVDTLGWILVDNRQYARALELLRKATVLAPQESEIRYHLAVALHRAGRNDDARSELQEILRLGKDFASAAEARDLLRSLSQ